MDIGQNHYYKDLLEKIRTKNIKIGIIGLGYVGLPLALTFCENNIKVIGLDIKKTIINSLLAGKSYIHHINSLRIKKQIDNKYLIPTNDFSNIEKVDVIIICVPTPLDRHREPDLSFILSTLDSIKKYLFKGQILSLESTTYPGTTDEVIKPIIESEGFKIGKDFFLIYSPEREDPGNKLYQTNNIPKILGGNSILCSEIGKNIYEQIIPEVVLLSSTKAAEMTKLIENIHRAVNIGLVNELKPLSDCLGIDLYEVIRAAATKPFGFTPFYPGPGLGGHCIPIDPYYLTWKAKEYGMNMRFIELAGEINSSMPQYVINKLAECLNKKCKSINKSKILILGVAYKKNVDDLRESPSLEIIDILIKQGAVVNYNDPYFPELPSVRKYNFNIKNVPLNKKNIMQYDCAILLTDHDSFDYDLIKENSKLIIDTRGKFELSDNIVRS
tara:strand:+ start:10110 stop:11435 length:1326 start_codon:yes stop_codon:yes gene_type:complete